MILIIPHEFGHFIASKLLGVGVEEFSFGMGPALLQKQGKKTLYSVRAFPIGGYCKLAGEEEDDGSEDAFVTKPAWKKVIILMAGVTMNVLTAFIIMTAIFLALYGDPLKAPVYAAQAVYNMTGLIGQSLYMLFTGGIALNELSGPVGIIGAVNETVSAGLVEYFALTALLCVNLAIFNALPFPALDGGRTLMVVIRKFTGGMISDKTEAVIHGAGMLILLGLMFVVTFRDVIKLM